VTRKDQMPRIKPFNVIFGSYFNSLFMFLISSIHHHHTPFLHHRALIRNPRCLAVTGGGIDKCDKLSQPGLLLVRTVI